MTELRVFGGRFQFIIKLVQSYSQLTAGFSQIKFDFLFRGQRVNHIGDTACHIDSVKQNDGLGTIWHRNGHMVVFPDAERVQCLGAYFNYDCGLCFNGIGI